MYWAVQVMSVKRKQSNPVRSFKFIGLKMQLNNRSENLFSNIRSNSSGEFGKIILAVDGNLSDSLKFLKHIVPMNFQ